MRVPPEVAGVEPAGVVVAFVALVDMLMLVHSLETGGPVAGCCVWPAVDVLTTLVVFEVPSAAAPCTRPVMEGVLSSVATPRVSSCTHELQFGAGIATN